MSKFIKGDIVSRRGWKDARITDTRTDEYYVVFGDGSRDWHEEDHMDTYWSLRERVAESLPAEENAVSPNVYKFPNAEVRDISAHLTSFGGQAVQYVARATRLDGLVKGKPEQDIEKAIQVLQWELERLQEVN